MLCHFTGAILIYVYIENVVVIATSRFCVIASCRYYRLIRKNLFLKSIKMKFNKFAQICTCLEGLGTSPLLMLVFKLGSMV